MKQLDTLPASNRVQVRRVDHVVRGQEYSSIPVPKKKTHSWLRRKEELNRLRQQTEEMETHVAFLQLKKRGQRGVTLGSRDTMTARLEQKRLQESQQDNNALKDQLRVRLQILAALQAALSANSLQEQLPNIATPASLESPQQLQIDASIFRNQSGPAIPRVPHYTGPTRAVSCCCGRSTNVQRSCCNGV